MERICFLLQVRPEKLDEYKKRHQQVWPEMLQALTHAGWRNYSLFLRDDGLLVGYLETPDFKQALLQMEQADVNERWQRDMQPFFTGLAGRPDQAMMRLEEIFHLD